MVSSEVAYIWSSSKKSLQRGNFTMVETTEALMPSMMVRYAGPKVFVALQETEGIHDEGGTRELPLKHRFFGGRFFCHDFSGRNNANQWKGKCFCNKEVEWKQGQMCLTIMEFGYKVQHGKLWTSRFVLEIGYIIYIFTYTYLLNF